MPTKSECDRVVRNSNQFVNAVTKDNVSIYIEDDIDISVHVRRNGGIDIGSNVTIVGGFCDPNIPGRGPELVCKTNGYRALTSGYNTAPTLWGVSMRGPQLTYSDPDHNAADFDSKHSTGLFCYDDKGTLEVIGCEMRGWTMAGLEVGARGHETTARVRRTSLHHNQMEHLGYGIQHYQGALEVDWCFFDRCRHGISGFGYPECSWSLSNSVVGPNDWSGHALDMHCLANNLSASAASKYPLGGDTAGGDIRIRRCSLMITEDRAGYGQEAFALRGIPTGEARIEKTHFWHESQPTETNVQGNAYRQENGSWQNFYVEDCAFGASNLTDGVGAPRARKGHEDDDEPEQDDPSGQPSEPTMQRLKVTGHGGPGVHGDYSIIVHGDVEGMEDTEKSEQIEDLDEERVRITGNMWGGVDVFLLADDALPVSAEWETPCSIWLDETDMTGSLGGVESTQRFDELQAQLNHLQAQLDKLRLWASELGDALSFSAGDDE